MYFPRGTLVTGGRPLSERATVGRRLPGHRVYEVDPGTGRASYRNVGLAIVGGLVKPNLYLHGFRGTSIDYRSHEPGHSAGRALRSTRAVFGAEHDCAVITQATKLLLPFLVVGNLAATFVKLQHTRADASKRDRLA